MGHAELRGMGLPWMCGMYLSWHVAMHWGVAVGRSLIMLLLLVSATSQGMHRLQFLLYPGGHVRFAGHGTHPSFSIEK